MIERISILGTGLLGTSVGLALRAAGFRGHDHGLESQRRQAAARAEVGAVDSLAADAIEAAQASQVTVLAVPIYATLDWMEKLAPVLGAEQLVTDVGSTKARDLGGGSAALQHAGARGVFARSSNGGKRARRRGAG